MRLIFILMACFLYKFNINSQQFNYDENLVPSYTLPQLFIDTIGNNTYQWEKYRRTEIIELFGKEIYGFMPPENFFQIKSRIIESSLTLNSKAIRKQVQLLLIHHTDTLDLNILLYIPNTGKKYKTIVALNFFGNHTICEDSSIIISKKWMRNSKEIGISNHSSDSSTIGKRSHRWPIDYIINQEICLATLYCGDTAPDNNDQSDGIYRFIKKYNSNLSTDFGCITAWGWGLCRAMDYLTTTSEVDPQQVFVMGHSRLAKAALWAAANDKRFAGVISNSSGCMGAALSRREFGETVQRITTRYPYWFCSTIQKYSNDVNGMPVDQHMLLALIAPRPLYVASAKEDLWADPKGEFLALKEATNIYKLYKYDIALPEEPIVNVPIPGKVAYHIRDGKHDVTNFDWEQYCNWINKYLKH